MNAVLGADFNKNAAETHEKNYPDVPFLAGDLSDREVQSALFDKLPKEIFVLLVDHLVRGFRSSVRDVS